MRVSIVPVFRMQVCIKVGRHDVCFVSYLTAAIATYIPSSELIVGNMAPSDLPLLRTQLFINNEVRYQTV